MIAPGTRLGPYEIVAPIASGGMGEVYRARDTRLERSVAIKILPAELAANAQFRVRFDREAKTISQLEHPNICRLYDVGDNYLVMELLDGETLADRLKRGPLPLSDTLKTGSQIADALDRAHRAGIVHRDLKPGNVMLTKSGVKLLDFGLAKEQASALGPRSADMETAQKPLTTEGMIVGTFQYMAPEQLEGEEADPRTDIFALGAVLYEMATGRRAFDGKSKTSLIAAIVSATPKPISEIQPLTPSALEHIVSKCLEKEREDRWQSAHDVAEELRWIGSTTTPGRDRTARKLRMWQLASAAVGIALLAVLGASVALTRRTAIPPLALSITPPPHAPFETMFHAALSPDGTTVAFIGYSQTSGTSLWLRPLGARDPRPLPMTQGAVMPFWSPDGKQIGFFAEGKLKRIAVAGGPAQVICDAPVAFGGTWNRDGVILFGCEGLGPLYRVNAAGGKRQPATKLEPREEAHRWPFFLPDGDHFLFLGDASRAEDHWIRVGSLRDGKSRDLIQAVTNAAYVDGNLLYIRAGSLLAQPFDPKSLTLTAEPRVLAEQVVPNFDNHHFEFSAAANDSLVYRSASPDSQLAWVDRSGKVLQTVGEPQRIRNFTIAPDQQRIAAACSDADGRPDDVWLLDVTRGIRSRATLDPAGDSDPVWSPDGSKIVFSSMRTGLGDLYIADPANPANAQRLTSITDTLLPTSWSPDGKNILLTRMKKVDLDIDLYSFATQQVQPYVSTPFEEELAVFSPDGASIAYVSYESGREQIYVERFPSHAARRQVSTSGGNGPVWRRDGRELFYVGPGLMLMSVDMTTANATPQPLFQLARPEYDVSADGRRFLTNRPVDDARKTPLTFVSGWK